MNNYPLVSIGIPFYNAGVFLKYAITSVVNQTYSNWELILINDGSSDCYLDIISEFNDNRIKLLSDGCRLGLPARLNKLSLHVQGEYYARMDADDIMHPERIEKQIRYLIEHPELDVIGSGSYYIDQDNQVLGGSKHFCQSPRSINDILNGGAFIHPSVMGKTSWFMNNPYDESLLRMQDLALWISTVESSCFFIMPDRLLYYRAVGIPSLLKYLRTQRYFRSYLNTIHIDGFTHKMINRLYLKSLLKSFVYTLFSLFGKSHILIRKRYCILKPDVIGEAEMSLQYAIR